MRWIFVSGWSDVSPNFEKSISGASAIASPPVVAPLPEVSAFFT
jgi:hypothetical protein